MRSFLFAVRRLWRFLFGGRVVWIEETWRINGKLATHEQAVKLGAWAKEIDAWMRAIPKEPDL